MNNTDKYYTEKVLSILHSNDSEAIKQLEQTIEILHIYLQPKIALSKTSLTQQPDLKFRELEQPCSPSSRTGGRNDDDRPIQPHHYPIRK
jgi:hypothetical protein